MKFGQVSCLGGFPFSFFPTHSFFKWKPVIFCYIVSNKLKWGEGTKHLFNRSENPHSPQWC
jgi:hypothetical protein